MNHCKFPEISIVDESAFLGGGGDRSLHICWTFPFVLARASDRLCVRHTGLLCPPRCLQPQHCDELFFAYFTRESEMAVRLFIALSKCGISSPLVLLKIRRKNPNWQSWKKYFVSQHRSLGERGKTWLVLALIFHLLHHRDWVGNDLEKINISLAGADMFRWEQSFVPVFCAKGLGVTLDTSVMSRVHILLETKNQMQCCNLFVRMAVHYDLF